MFFVQGTYATSRGCPPEFQYMPLDSIISLKIAINNDFDQDHLESSDITDLFYAFQDNEFIEISEYIKNIETELYDFTNPTFEFDILLISPPTIGVDYEFEVSFELSDGRILKAQTGIIKLN